MPSHTYATDLHSNITGTSLLAAFQFAYQFTLDPQLAADLAVAAHNTPGNCMLQLLEHLHQIAATGHALGVGHHQLPSHATKLLEHLTARPAATTHLPQPAQQIVELRQAGWELSDIAQTIGCTRQTAQQMMTAGLLHTTSTRHPN